jgi:hypothetical protein
MVTLCSKYARALTFQNVCTDVVVEQSAPALSACVHLQAQIQKRRKVLDIGKKETQCSVKRDLMQCQKRPNTEAKET